ncbi:MAG: DUF1622 domain-containing protein [Sinimarinibacterium sp.]|jgi:uncharacterized membrane protein
MNTFRGVMEWVGLAFDAIGVVVIAAGAMAATWRLLVRTPAAGAMGVRRFRQEFGGAIVLSLEFLVAGDIIRTVVVAPTLENVAVLAIIVLVRTVLSMALQVEIEGRWPWQRHGAAADGQSPPPLSAAVGSAAAHPTAKEDRT